MSRYNRPMRAWRPQVVVCSACGKPITGEAKMVGRDVVLHVLCIAKWRREKESA